MTRVGIQRRRAFVWATLVALLGLASVAASGADGATATRLAVPALIPADCSVDVTKLLNWWVGAAPDGSTLQLAHDGCYRVDGTLSLSGRHDLTLDGNGASLEAVTPGTAGHPVVSVVSGSDITVENLSIVGPNPRPAYNSRLQWQPGISLAGVDGALVTGVSISHVYGDFITITSSNKVPASDVTITSSRFDTAGRQGIAIISAAGVDIDGVTLGNTAMDTFDLESNAAAQGASNVTIQNTTSFGKGAVWFSAGGQSAGTTDHVIVRNNVMTTTQAGDVINLWSPAGTLKGPFTFTGNQLRAGASSSVAALQLTRTADATFDGNTISFANYGKSASYTHETAVYLFQCSNVSFTDNSFVGPGQLVRSYQSTGTQSGNQVVQ